MMEALGILIDNYSFKMSFGFESFKRRQASSNKTFIFIEFFVLLMLVSCDKDNGSASKIPLEPYLTKNRIGTGTSSQTACK